MAKYIYTIEWEICVEADTEEEAQEIAVARADGEWLRDNASVVWTERA